MIRPRSIKRKLQSWVIIIFVLTGTAGWAGIWGLLYISSSTRSLTGEQVQRAQDVDRVRVEIAAMRRAERDYLVAAALADAPRQKAEGQRITAAWAQLGARLKQLREGQPDGIRALEAAESRVAAAWGEVEAAAGAGKSLAEVQAGAYADYDKRVAELDQQAAGVTEASFGAVKTQNSMIYERIKVLGLALFATVLLCQLFSAWAGRQLSGTITGELGALRESAERISMGDLKSEVKVATGDIEIVEVGEALDRLRVSLGKAMDRLAKRAPRPAES